MKKLNIITSVERTLVTSLQGMTRISKTVVKLPSGIVWSPLDIKPHASLSITDKQEDKNTVWTAKLVFKTPNDLENREHYAYRVRLYDGRYRLIGSGERPYPVLSVVENMPENITENQLNEATVEWITPYFIPFIRE